MKPASRALALRTTRRRTNRMNELQAVLNQQNQREGFEHRDGYATIERSWQPEPAEYHIGFRA